MVISRRGFLAASAALVPAAAFAADKTLALRCVAAIRAALAAMPPGPALLNSYVIATGPDASDFDLTQANAAYVYDNALAGLALIAAGFRGEAGRIGDALAMAQANDRFWKDGRLRNAYQAGGMAKPAKLAGWWDAKANLWQEDPYQAGSQTGPIAWAMLLWAALDKTTPANLAANWLDDQLRAPNGYYGGFYGFEPKPLKLTWQSTEQNTDLFTAFLKLHRAEDAAHAGTFVRTMFDPENGMFETGISPDNVRNKLLAADAGIWPFLAGLGGAQSAATAIATLRRGNGIGFSSASDSIWLEGTAFAALALAGRNSPAARQFYQTIGGNLSPSGYVYASITPVLATGLTVGPSLQPGIPAQSFNYYRRPALAPTAWSALAGLDVNPLAR